MFCFDKYIYNVIRIAIHLTSAYDNFVHVIEDSLCLNNTTLFNSVLNLNFSIKIQVLLRICNITELSAINLSFQRFPIII